MLPYFLNKSIAILILFINSLLITLGCITIGDYILFEKFQQDTNTSNLVIKNACFLSDIYSIIVTFDEDFINYNILFI